MYPEGGTHLLRLLVGWQLHFSAFTWRADDEDVSAGSKWACGLLHQVRRRPSVPFRNPPEQYRSRFDFSLLLPVCRPKVNEDHPHGLDDVAR